jgi:membrane-bound serine protease (ClpP class)
LRWIHGQPFGASVRRLPRRAAILGILLMATALVAPLAAPASAQEPPADNTGLVMVIQVNGYLDPIEVDFIERSVGQAQDDQVAALIIQLDSQGAVVSDATIDRLAGHLRDATVDVGVWVGPSGAVALGRAADLVTAAKYRGLAPGSRLDIGTRRVGADEAFTLGRTNIPATCERQQGSTEGCAATIGDFVVSIPSVPTKPVEQNGQTRIEPTGQTRFAQLSLVNRLLHSVASPPVAYLLFVIGMALLLFELFTAGVGVAGVVGAGAFLFGCYGLAVLPTRPFAIALLVFSMFGYAVDIQTGVPRAWTGIATVSFALGTLFLYDGVSLSWITLVAGVLGMTVAMIAGMPAMVRARFSTPTIGREWMIGEEGEARTAIAPDGTVLVRGAPWKARTNRATPIAQGDPVRVAAIEGLVLDVEPLVGAARDYRERRSAGSAGDES